VLVRYSCGASPVLVRRSSGTRVVLVLRAVIVTGRPTVIDDLGVFRHHRRWANAAVYVFSDRVTLISFCITVNRSHRFAGALFNMSCYIAMLRSDHDTRRHPQCFSSPRATPPIEPERAPASIARTTRPVGLRVVVGCCLGWRRRRWSQCCSWRPRSWW
jgi:hypothetical protein